MSELRQDASTEGWPRAPVTDSGSPPKTNAKSFVATVLDLRVTPPTLTSNGVTISWTAILGQTYRLQYKTNLTDAAWVDLSTDVTATNGTMNISDPAIYPQRFYRLLLLP